jgi:hypothetical protein
MLQGKEGADQVASERDRHAIIVEFALSIRALQQIAANLDRQDIADALGQVRRACNRDGALDQSPRWAERVGMARTACDVVVAESTIDLLARAHDGLCAVRDRAEGALAPMSGSDTSGAIVDVLSDTIQDIATVAVNVEVGSLAELAIKARLILNHVRSSQPEQTEVIARSICADIRALSGADQPVHTAGVDT